MIEPLQTLEAGRVRPEDLELELLVAAFVKYDALRPDSCRPGESPDSVNADRALTVRQR